MLVAWPDNDELGDIIEDCCSEKKSLCAVECVSQSPLSQGLNRQVVNCQFGHIMLAFTPYKHVVSS